MDILIEKRDRQSAALGGWWARLQAARWVWVPLLVFGGTRLGILLVAYLAAGLMADSPFVPPYHLRGMANVPAERPIWKPRPTGKPYCRLCGPLSNPKPRSMVGADPHCPMSRNVTRC